MPVQGPIQTPAGAAPECAVLDLAHLQAQCMGDDALAAELLQMFRIQALQIAALMARAGPAAALAADAHKLRGSAAAVGACAVAAAAAGLEAACQRGGSARDPALAALAAAVERATDAIGLRLDGRFGKSPQADATN